MVGLTDLQLKTIELLNPWIFGKELELGVLRERYLSRIDDLVKNTKQFLFILGSRRLGKTTIIFQYIDHLIREGVEPREILFLSLDNTNLDNVDLYNLLADGKYKYVFLDEVHYLKNWAKILKSLYDLPGYKTKIIASGSSSTAIKDNEAFLTGRSRKITVAPLSYLELKDFDLSITKLDNYLFYGGYPEYVMERNPNYLNELLRDVIEKDVIKVHKIRNSQNLIVVAQMLAKQVGHVGSSNKISRVLGLDNKTVLNFVHYLEEVQLISPVFQYAKKLNERLYSPKKYYFQDLGMRNSLVGYVDLGAIVENAVFIKLKELYGEENIFYGLFDRGEEVDFVVKIGGNKIILIESKYINLKESVISKLPGAFWGDDWDGKVQTRIVVTDNVEGMMGRGQVKAELIGLGNFLARPREG